MHVQKYYLFLRVPAVKDSHDGCTFVMFVLLEETICKPYLLVSYCTGATCQFTVSRQTFCMIINPKLLHFKQPIKTKKTS